MGTGPTNGGNMKVLFLLMVMSLASCDFPRECAPGATVACIRDDGHHGYKICNSDGHGWSPCDCECERDCIDRVCGDDGCDGSCGVCGAEETCIGGQCRCAFLACQGKCCGEGERCIDNSCCGFDCSVRSCGPDGCGGECPPGCNEGFWCNDDGICIQD